MGSAISKNEILPTDIPDKKKPKVSFKIVLIGDCNVGKSCVFQRYVNNQFTVAYRPTDQVEIENITQKINFPQVTCAITLLDIPGNEDIDLRDTYYRNADGAIVVVDLNDSNSIEMAGTWKQDFCKRVSKVVYRRFKDKKTKSEKIVTEYLPCDGYNIPVLLLGNKIDIIQELLKEETKNDHRFNQEEADFQKQYQQVCDDLNFEVNLDNGNEPIKETKETNFRNDDNDNDDDDDDDEDGDAVNKSDNNNNKFRKMKKPPCVKLLESVEREYGFFSSISASAKYSTSSKAIRILLNRLLELHGFKEKEEREKIANDEYEEDEEELYGLERCFIEEIDSVVNATLPLIVNLEDTWMYYELIERKLKQVCFDVDLTTSTHASLEDCVYAVKSKMLSVSKEVKCQPKKLFVQLTYVDSEAESDDDDEEVARLRAKLPLGVGSMLEVFNDEYSIVCSQVLGKVPVICEKLCKMDEYFAERTDRCDQLTPKIDGGNDPNRVHRNMKICENNRARIAHYIRMGEKLLDLVTSCKEKVGLALVW